jgi:hypothetical protein
VPNKEAINEEVSYYEVNTDENNSYEEEIIKPGNKNLNDSQINK